MPNHITPDNEFMVENVEIHLKSVETFSFEQEEEATVLTASNVTQLYAIERLEVKSTSAIT